MSCGYAPRGIYFLQVEECLSTACQVVTFCLLEDVFSRALQAFLLARQKQRLTTMIYRLRISLTVKDVRLNQILIIKR